MTDDLIRRGYESELRRHRDNLARGLDGVHRAANELSADLGAGETQLAGRARRLLADAGDVAQAAAALEAASQLGFTLDEA